MPACCAAWTVPWPPLWPNRTPRPHPRCWWPRPCWRRWRGVATAACPCRRWPVIRMKSWPGPRRLCACSYRCGSSCRARPATGCRPCAAAPWCASCRPGRSWPTAGSHWCCGMAPRPCCTCAATGTTSAAWPRTSHSARQPVRWRWTSPGCATGWGGCSARPPRLRRRWTGNSWPARWRCAGACPSSPAARARARPIRRRACWRCCLPRRRMPRSCVWRWRRPRARRRRGSSNRLIVRCGSCRGPWAAIWIWKRWSSAWARRAPCMRCWAPGPTRGAWPTMRAIRWMSTCSSSMRPP